MSDPAIITEALAFAKRTNDQNPANTLPFVGDGRNVDVWELTLASLNVSGASRNRNASAVIPPTTLLSVDNLTSSGAVLRSNRFNFSSCSSRLKSSDSLIVNNTFSMSYGNIALTDLPRWFEGAPFISNVSFVSNVFRYGTGVNPVHPNPAITSDIVERDNQYLAQ